MHSARQLIRLVSTPLRPHPFTPCPRLLTSYSPLLKTSQTSSGTGQTGSASGPSDEAKNKARRLSVAAGSATAFFGASYILYLQLRAEDKVSIF